MIELGLVILTMLYIYQGLILGLAGGGIQLHFHSDPQIGLFSFCLIPFMMKFLWSPILDYYYIDKIGKRKSYIIPLHTIVAILLYLGSQQTNLMDLFYYFIIIILSIATADTAIDGWQCTILSNPEQGSVCQNFGQAIGWFISNYLSLHFSSLEDYMQILAIIALFIAILLIFVPESNPQETALSFTESFAVIKGFYRNKLFRKLCIFLLLKRAGLGPMDQLMPVILLRNGFPRIQLTNIASVAFIITIFLPILTGVYIIANKLANTSSIYTLVMMSFNMLAFTFTLYFGILNPYLVGLHFIVHESLKKMFYTTIFSFVTSISDPAWAGVQISWMGSISNISRVIIDPLIITLSFHMEFWNIAIIGFIYELLIVYRFGSEFIEMQSVDKNLWKLHQSIDQYKEIEMK